MIKKHQIWLILLIIISYVGCGDSRKDVYEDGKKVGFEQGYNKGYAKGKQDALKELKKSPMQRSNTATLGYLGALFIIGAALTITVWIVMTKRGAKQEELQNIHETLKQMQEEMNETKAFMADLTLQSADRI